MCSIIGSSNPQKFIELVKMNQFRGNFSYSFAILKIYENKVDDVLLFKDFGEFDPKLAVDVKNNNNDAYFIGHVQAPTGGLVKDIHRIHPSKVSYVTEIKETTLFKSDSYLWHNGILKDSQIKVLQDKFDCREDWDTYLLHLLIRNNGFDELSSIDGSFGCVYMINGEIFIFTSDIITIFVDDKLNASSTFFTGSQRIYPNTIYKMNFMDMKLEPIQTFKSKSSPYFMD